MLFKSAGGTVVDLLLGTSLSGGYTRLRAIGSGGMGTIYLAEDPTIGQQVAIKVVRADTTDYPDTTSLLQPMQSFRQLVLRWRTTGILHERCHGAPLEH